MNLYPAITFRMGDWDYYVVKMTARELSESVKFAHEIYDDRTLDEAIQRTLNEGRVKKEIVTYLSRQPARFFSSIVIAAIEGDPKFYPVEVTDDERFSIFRDDSRLNSSFGVLAFDGTQKYYALDGQHRLAAIRTLLNKEDPLSRDAPAGFEDDELSVIIVVPKLAETEENFLQRYRRLFSNLNRYAKPTSKSTNIVMDEDDAFAIVTRRLIMEHEFFRWDGRDADSKRIKTSGGKSLRAGDPYFTSIVTLYEMNLKLLNSRIRQDRGWSDGDRTGENLKTFRRFRPSEECLEKLYNELNLYWNGLVEELPELRRPPSEMREHDIGGGGGAHEGENGQADSLLFWPIGQELLAELVRDLLDLRQAEPETPSDASVSTALRGLGGLNWELHGVPWRYLLLTRDPEAAEGESGGWRMRSEDRKEAVRLGLRMLRWLIGLDDLGEDEVGELRIGWESRLMPAQSAEEVERLWEEILTLRATLAS